jgi:hypothetical protein
MKRDLTACPGNRLSRSSATARRPVTFRQLTPSRTITSASRTATADHRPLETPIRLEFFHPTARPVCVAGSFNDWNPSATPLVSLGGGRWLRLIWLRPGQYEYLFVADGVWFFDPNASDYAPNVYGTMNAIVEVAASDGGSKGVQPRRLPLRNGRRMGPAVSRHPREESGGGYLRHRVLPREGFRSPARNNVQVAVPTTCTREPL